MPPERTSQPAAWYLDAAPASIAAWLVRMRWTRAAVDMTVLVASLVLSSADFPLHRLAPFVAAAALANGDIALHRSRGRRVPTWMMTVDIAIAVVLLTGLLELSGGPSNPFSIIYVVLIGLAAAVVSRPAALLIGGWAALCYGLLIYWHLEELVPSHHRLIDFPTHLFTMWIAIAVTAELVAHFVHEASTAVARREAELDDMRRRAVRSERLMSLTTLAAGAAHELSTPLSTIAVASRDLDRALAAAPGAEGWASDARLIREQVDRCHAILDQMSGRAGGGAVDMVQPTDIVELFADLRQRLPPDQADRMRVAVAPELPSVLVPRAGLAQVMLSLINNAFDATDMSKPVIVEGTRQAGLIQLIVRDEGRGMSPAVLGRAGEPFYTTKEPGSGLGLGLFLARMFAERCGGTLTLHSDRGTTAILELPLQTERPETA